MNDGFDFSVQEDAPEPIYRQLTEHVRRRVASGTFKAGDSMPSVRVLAQRLAVSTMTISKAYMQLEADGVLERRRGAAMRVAHGHVQAQSTAERLEILAPALKRAAEEARQLNLGKADVLTLFREMLEQSRKGRAAHG
jgi:GntR family transcriptional regulator